MRLVKDITVTEISPYVPAETAVPPISFRTFAPPTPQGWAYRPIFTETTSGFNSWSPVFKAPLTVTYVSTQVGTTYVPIADLVGGYIPPGSTPVYGEVTLPPGNVPPTAIVIVGYNVPVFSTVPAYSTPQWYGPIANMTYFSFDAPVSPNGYPTTGGVGTVHTGTVQIPTTSGLLTVTRQFKKDSNGILRVNESMAAIDYCVHKAVYGVTALIGFPGCAAIPAVPAVNSYDYHEGWNAGANSIENIDGDVHTVFMVDIGVAGAVGFCPYPRVDVTSKENLTHAFYFDKGPGGDARYQIMERGRIVRGALPYDPSVDEFEITREGTDGRVTYSVNDTVVFTSSAGVFGPLVVGTALYRGGDAIV